MVGGEVTFNGGMLKMATDFISSIEAAYDDFVLQVKTACESGKKQYERFIPKASDSKDFISKVRYLLWGLRVVDRHNLPSENRTKTINVLRRVNDTWNENC
jgi:hypothetical protein